jgi:glycosyltransferase involved in cell wall biosynthesis
VQEPPRTAKPRVGVDLRAVVRRPTGIGVYTLALLAELAATERFELVGLVHREPEAAPRLRELGIRVEVEPAPLGVIWQQRVLPQRLARGDLDLLWSPLLTLPRRLPIPGVVTIHDLAVLHVPETLSLKVRWSLLPFLEATVERAAAIVTVSESVAREVAEAWPAAAPRIVAIPNGVEAAFRPASAQEAAATRARLDAPDGYALYAGTLEPRKNVGTLLDAWEQLARERGGDMPPLLLAGPYGWRSRALERRIAALAGAGVRKLGWLEPGELVRTIAAASLFVYPSLYEGFGLPVAEAMACGVAVVCSDRSSLPEVVGDAGLLVDPEDPQALAGAIARLLDEPALGAELGRRGVARAARFTWAESARRLAAVFDRVLGSRGGGA